jgi:pyruvate dehydrogenase E2 component (dihydrolipoamide acetyltransferase)
VYELNIQLKGVGLSTDMFGSVLVSNIGSLGLDYGIPALLPASNLAFVQAIGKIKEVAVVQDGEIVARTVLPISASFDHRVVDGAHISRYIQGINYYFANPEELLK